MSEWSHRVADRFKKAKESQAVTDEVALRRDKALDEAYTRLRKELDTCLHSVCDDCNKETAIGNILVLDTSGDEWTLTRTDCGWQMSIAFDSSRRSVTLKSDQPAKFKRNVEVRTNAPASPAYYADPKGNSLKPETLSREAVCSLLGVDPS